MISAMRNKIYRDKPPAPGRPSKWAAKTVLADVYMHLSKWPEARDKAAEVINAAKYSMVEVATGSLLEDFGPDVVSTA